MVQRNKDRSHLFSREVNGDGRPDLGRSAGTDTTPRKRFKIGLTVAGFTSRFKFFAAILAMALGPSLGISPSRVRTSVLSRTCWSPECLTLGISGYLHGMRQSIETRRPYRHHIVEQTTAHRHWGLWSFVFHSKFFPLVNTYWTGPGEYLLEIV